MYNQEGRANLLDKSEVSNSTQSATGWLNVPDTSLTTAPPLQLHSLTTTPSYNYTPYILRSLTTTLLHPPDNYTLPTAHVVGGALCLPLV